MLMPLVKAYGSQTIEQSRCQKLFFVLIRLSHDSARSSHERRGCPVRGWLVGAVVTLDGSGREAMNSSIATR
jgi:hypothetical protein